ncbi:MAG: Hsp33 family molecular chaperone HslO [Aestuariivita sp.]|nr:Hsp33 family molecular chaperone HslO [Aestuariivita sp.]
MANGIQIVWDDTVLPFQLEASDVRGRIVRVNSVLDDVLKQHDYPPLVQELITEIVVLTALIGQTIKLRWKLSLQVQAKGSIKMIAADYFAPQECGEPARIRSYASFDRKAYETNTPKFGFDNTGYFAVLIDQGEGTTPYQGITPLSGGSLRACAETYFYQSEQLKTKFLLSFGEVQDLKPALKWRAGGIMLQYLPQENPKQNECNESGVCEAKINLLEQKRVDDWNRANLLLGTVTDIELVNPSIALNELLYQLFAEEQLCIFDPQAIRFGCTCSEERVRNSLSIYSQNEIAKMITADNRVTADCQFCGAHYELDPLSLGFEAVTGKE